MSVEYVDPVWKAVQRHLDPEALDDIAAHPYVRWYMLNTGRFPDFLAASRQAAAEIHDDLLRRYRDTCAGALDEPEPGVVPPTSRTAQHFYYLVRIVQSFGDLSGCRVCEIGGGYGNLLRMFLQLDLCAGYDIVDIDRIVDIQRRYARTCLTPQQQAAARIHTIEDPDQAAEVAATRYDLVVSTFGVTEVPAGMREWYFREVIGRARFVYLVGQRDWRGQAVADHCLEALAAPAFHTESAPFVWSSGNEGPTFELVARRAE